MFEDGDSGRARSMTTDTAESARPHLGGIESLRGYAASAIILFHVVHLAGEATPRSLSFIGQVFGYGVPLFFVVSAFSLTYGYQGRLGSRGEIGRFYQRRLFRIAPLYYVALLFTIFTHGGFAWMGENLGLVALNFTFLFGLFPTAVDGIAPASWSIGAEMLFYAVLPLVLMVVRGPLSAAAATGMATIIAVISGVRLDALPDMPGAFIQHGFLFNLPYFGFGLLACFLYRRGGPPRPGWALAGAAVCLAMLYAMAMLPGPMMESRIGNTIFQALWGAPFALLCLGMAWAPPALLSNPLTQFLGKISFSLYLAHPHVIGWMKYFGGYERVNALPGGSGVHFPAAVLLTFAATVPVAWLLYRLVEEPGMALGRAVARGRPRRDQNTLP
ncbi:acyltransferase [soil metagenome]